MKLRRTSSILIVSALLVSAATSLHAQNARGEQQATLIDTNGFGRPVPAATIQIPAGWQPQGGVLWDRNSKCVGNLWRMSWVAMSPDGRQAIEIMPGYTWQVQGTEIRMNPCPSLPIQSASEFLQRVARRHGNVRVLQYRDRPDLSQALAAAAAKGGGSNQFRIRYDAGELLIAYQQGGQEMRETLTTSLTFSEIQGNIVGSTSSVSVQRAPNGQLDFALGKRIHSTVKVDSQWFSMMAQASQEIAERLNQQQQREIAEWHNRRMGDINALGAAQRSQIAMQGNREVAQIYSNTWKNGQATDDVIQRRNLEAVGEYNTYNDPVGGNTVRSSIHNDPRVIRHGDGTYTTTDDPYYQPSGSIELERVP